MPNAAAVPFVSVAQLTRAMARKTPVPQIATKHAQRFFSVNSLGFERLTQGYTIAENVDKSANARHQEEASVLQSCRVPTGGYRISVEPLLREFRGVLCENNRSAGLEERERYNSPENPGQLQDLFGLKLLRLLREFLSSCRIRDIAKFLVCDAVEPVEE